MKRFLLLLLTLFVSLVSWSQNVIREGNRFIQQSSESTIKKDNPQPTPYEYVAKDGKVYPIYLSSKGKAFIIRVSKKTGKEWKQYLPEVTQELEKKKQ